MATRLRRVRRYVSICAMTEHDTAQVELSGREHARIVIAEVDAALTEGRPVNPRVFERPAAKRAPSPGWNNDHVDFRSHSRAEQTERRAKYRRQRHERAGVPLGEPRQVRDKNSSRDGYGWGD